MWPSDHKYWSLALCFFSPGANFCQDLLSETWANFSIVLLQNLGSSLLLLRTRGSFQTLGLDFLY
jgi:hypothetical protein